MLKKRISSRGKRNNGDCKSQNCVAEETHYGLAATGGIPDGLILRNQKDWAEQGGAKDRGRHLSRNRGGLLFIEVEAQIRGKGKKKLKEGLGKVEISATPYSRVQEKGPSTHSQRGGEGKGS